MKNNDKYVEAKKYLQKRYPKELSDKRWNTSDINDDWVTEMMTDFASQSKPESVANIVEISDNESTIKSVTSCPTCGSECEVGSGDSGSHYYIPKSKPQEIDVKNAMLHVFDNFNNNLSRNEVENRIDDYLAYQTRIKTVDTKTVDAVEFAEWLKVNNHELKLDSGYRSDEHNAKLLNLYKQDIESTFFELLGEPIMGVDTKTVDAVEFLHWVRENDFVYSGGAGWYKDEFDIVIVNALTYITDAELLNLYIESKK